MTIVRKCTCNHAQQDKMYGKGQRLHNIVDGEKHTVKGRCTVCEKEN